MLPLFWVGFSHYSKLLSGLDTQPSTRGGDSISFCVNISRPELGPLGFCAAGLEEHLT